MTPYIILSQPPLPTFWGATPPLFLHITQYYIIFYNSHNYCVVSLSLFSVVCGFIVRSLPWYFYPSLMLIEVFFLSFLLSLLFILFTIFFIIVFILLYFLDHGSLTYCDFDILSCSMFCYAFLYCLYNILYICFFICHIITLIFFYILLQFFLFWLY